MNSPPALPVGPVLVVGRFHTESVALHIAETLEAMELPVVRFETHFELKPDASRLRKGFEAVRTRVGDLMQGVPVARELFAQRLLDTARENNAAFSLVCHDFLMPDEVDRLRQATGAPVALWFPDAISNFGRAWFLNAPYDALFFKDPYSVDVLLRTLDKPIHYLPEAFNPVRHDAGPLTDADLREYGCDLCVAGNLYTYRAEFFARLSDYDVRIWGNPAPMWMRTEAIAGMVQNRYLVDEAKARAFRAAKICVNNLNYAEIHGINARAFEVAGIGGFQLLDWRPGIEGLFVDGEELVTFRDMSDLRAKIDHYLAHPEERETIARRGRERALKDHRFEVRLRLLFDTVLGDSRGHPMPRIETRVIP